MENWEREKLKYIRILEAIISGISNILNMGAYAIMAASLKEKLVEWKQDSEKLLRKLKNNEFEIAIVGLEKAGKSSFSNAFMENSLLPTDQGRCTYTSTCISYNETDLAEITFYTKEEFARNFSDKLKKIGIEQPEHYSFELLTRQQYEQLFSHLDVSKQKSYGSTLNQDILETIEYKQSILNYLGNPIKQFSGESFEEFKGFIKEPSKAIAVKEITIGSKLLKRMPNAFIYDIPGFNSPTEMHQQQTRTRMKSADVIVIIAKADEPSLTGEVLDVFRECDNDGTVLNDKLFVFANKADRANISKNREITYDEWITKRNILNEKQKNRIFFGSSNAHLQKIGKLPYEDRGNDYITPLKMRGMEDGIDEIRAALEEYNRTFRFEVFKGRINKIKGALSTAFEEISKNYSFSEESSFVTGDKIDLALNFKSEFIDKVVKNLQSYRDDIVRGRMQTEKPLSEGIAKYILDTITVENYQITEEELEKAHKCYISSVTEHEAPHTIESPLRREKFEKMYHDFFDAIMSISVENHVKCRGDIIGIIMEAMNLTTESLYYDKIYNQLKDEFSDKISRSTDEGYYQSLIERFSRDIYEILIQCTYSEERYNKFIPEMDNFFSFSVFYNPDLKEENKLDYIHKAPKDQILCNLLLFHDYHRSVNQDACEKKAEKLAAKVKKFAGLKEISTMNQKLIQTIVQRDYHNADEIILDILEDCDIEEENQTTISAKVSMLLQRAVRGLKEEEQNHVIQADLSKPAEFRQAYANYFAQIRGNRTYEDMKHDFACDIEILRDVLLHAFIRAINMEKSFVAREVKTIEYVISWIESKEFNTFISNNIEYIKAEEFDNLDRAEAEIKMRSAFMTEINKIIATINNVQ